MNSLEHTPMRCEDARSHFSDYLDGAISGIQMHAVAEHIDACEDCRQEFALWRGVQGALHGTGVLKPPADLGLKLRLAISHENAKHQGHWWDSLGLRWENVMRPALVQLSAGLAGALLLVGGTAMLVGVVAAPGAVQANDEPLGAMTSPHYLYSTVPQRPIDTSQDSPIVIEAKVNQDGRVYDFSILSGPQDQATLDRVRDELMVQVYEPARVFGEAVRGRALVTFSGVSVHG